MILEKHEYLDSKTTLTLCGKTHAVLSETFAGITMPADYSSRVDKRSASTVPPLVDALRLSTLQLANECGL